jgi:prepilin-type N-terminal cleavage/methylation domain-containing protein
MYHNQTGSQSNGYSLVELLAVVAIVGILVAVGAPAYCKYSSQSKQAQAKTLLSTLYVAESTFRIQGGSYTACLADIGVNATGAAPVQYYAFGFNSTTVQSSPNNCGTGSQTCFSTNWQTNTNCGNNYPASGTAANEVYFNAAANADSANGTVATGAQLNPKNLTPSPASWVTSSKFFAMAVGNISSCNSNYDRWAIDQNKNLTNDTPAL